MRVSDDLARVWDALAARRQDDEAALFSLLRIPSVSADSAYAAHVREAAENVREQMTAAGLTTRIVPTAGHPIVYGEYLGAGPTRPTVMVYGHYDVQPADPLELWTTPPFEPTVRDGYVYARGATDDKGQMLTHVKSTAAWMAAVGKVPVNLKFVIEGEEEVGSDHLDQFLRDNQNLLAADIAVVSDTSQYGPGIPAITYGLRGIVACEVRLTGPNRDLHSGVFGGSVANPAHEAAKLVTLLHDHAGHVLIPGFYEHVTGPDAAERERLAALPFDEVAFQHDLQVPALFGEAGFTTTERRWARPTCEVNGLTSGYAGEGPKTIVPSRATIKLTCRLVPDQRPAEILQNLEAYLRSHCSPAVTMEFKVYHGCEALVFDPTGDYFSAASRAIEMAFGTAPVLIREGGSIPVVKSFRDILGLETLLLGWGQNSDNLHSPNERFTLADYHRGIAASAALWSELSRLAPRSAQMYGGCDI